MQTTNNIKSIRGAVGHRGNKKFFSQMGESENRSASVSTSRTDFLKTLAKRGRACCNSIASRQADGMDAHQIRTFGLTTRCRKMKQVAIVLETLILILHINVGDAMLFNLLKCSGASRPGTRAFISWLEACDASNGIREGFLVLLPPHNAPGSRNIFTLHDWPRKTTSFVFKNLMGKMSF